jgi:hypothetical protein
VARPRGSLRAARRHPRGHDPPGGHLSRRATCFLAARCGKEWQQLAAEIAFLRETLAGSQEAERLLRILLAQTTRALEDTQWRALQAQNITPALVPLVEAVAD